MITKLSSYKSLVNNDLSFDPFVRNTVFKSFLNCKFSAFSSKKIATGSSLQIQGLATTYHNPDYVQDILCDNAFASQVDPHGRFCRLPFMYYEHNARAESPGRWTDVHLLPIGIQVAGEILSPSVIEAVNTELLSGLSIGFYIHSSERVYNHVKNKYYRYIKSAELVEISLVANPANSKAFFAPIKPLYYGQNSSVR